MAKPENDTKNEFTHEHHDVDLAYVNPGNIIIDDVNERVTNTGPRTNKGNLEKSVADNGIENPPQVRSRESESGYKVYAGQRRVQAAQTVGLEEIPVIVKELDDMDALAASVNENNEYLKKDVSRKDRAMAVEQLIEEWDCDKTADHFGVETQTIRNWLEPTRDFWQGSIFDPEKETSLNTDYIADDVLAGLRRVMDDADIAERAAKVVINKQIPKKVVRRSLELSENQTGFLENLQEQWKVVSSGQEQIRPQITLTDDSADRLQRWAKERGVNNEEATKMLVKKQLREIYD